MTHHRIKPKHALFATIFSGLALLSIASDAQTTGTSKKVLAMLKVLVVLVLIVKSEILMALLQL